MLTYIIRRLLYSIVVLLVASFLIFTFVTISGDPLAFLKMSPGVDPATIANIEARKHLNDPIVVQYAYWLKDAVTNQFGTTIIGERKIMPDIQRVMGHTLAAGVRRGVLCDHHRHRHRCLFGAQAIQRVRLLGDDLQLPRPCDARLLARPDAPGAVREHLPLVRHTHLLHREPERRRSRPRDPFRARSSATPCAADHRALRRQHRDVLEVHARLDARGDQLRLRPHRAGEGPARALG